MIANSYYTLIHSMGGGSTLNTGLIAYYKAENNANDELGLYNGTAIGGLTYTVGKNGNCFTFNGTNSYITLPNNTMAFTVAYSISLWFRTNSASTERYIITNAQKQGGAAGQWKGFQVFTYLSKVYFRLWNTNVNSDVVCTTTIVNSTWYHLVVTFSGTSQKIYINGVLEATNNSPVTPNYTTPNFPTIGATYYYGAVPYDTGTIFNGNIDEINLQNKELTQTEVTELYASGSGKFYPF